MSQRVKYCLTVPGEPFFIEVIGRPIDVGKAVHYLGWKIASLEIVKEDDQ